MAELTSGFVAGIIAAALLIARICFPTALSFILAGQLKDGETAATWTAASAPLQASYWPFWLRADQSKSHGVKRSVGFLTMALPTLAVLTAVASVVTPLGLYEEDVVRDPTDDVSFVYAPDSSAFSMATSPRVANTSFTRQCFYATCWAPCPYTEGLVVVKGDRLGMTCSTDDDILDMKVPQVLRDIYSSGTKSLRTTVSNFFDIEWRQMTTMYNRIYNNGTNVPAGTFRQLQSFALEDEPLIVEGLVVDAVNGGVGLRNHTVPLDMPRGATWSEDLLFLEPDVQCVDQNITLDYKISTSLGSSQGTISMTDFVLTDRGGFVNINHTHPYNDTRDGPNQPDLHMRALTAAWNFNRFAMFTMNVSNPWNETEGREPFEYINSEIGKTFKLPTAQFGLDQYQTLGFLQNFGEFLGFAGSSVFDDDLEWDNPYNITSEYFTDTRGLCEFTIGRSPTLLNSTYVACTLVRGVPRRTDGGQPTIFDGGSSWSSPLYTCASSVRATIKTVTFFHNGTTANVDDLRVKKIEEKTYPSEDAMPLWGVEQSFFELKEWKPIWGLVDAAYQGFPNITTIRQPWFYMLGTAEALFAAGLTGTSTRDNLPGAVAPISAMNSVVTGLSSLSSSSGMSDYSGKGSMSLWLRWLELSSSADKLPLIFKLLWTDLAASALVGTKGVLGEGNAQPELAVSIPAQRTDHTVRYRYAFGIPAFLTAFALLLVLLVLGLSVVTGHSSLKIMDQRLKQTSLGRSVTTLVNPESSTYHMSSKDWNKANGHRYLELGNGSSPTEEVAPQQSGVQVGPSEHMYTSVPRKPVGSGVGYNVEEYRPNPY